MYTKEKNTEKSKLTDNAEKINCEACYEPCIFELKDSVHTFNIGLLERFEIKVKLSLTAAIFLYRSVSVYGCNSRSSDI